MGNQLEGHALFETEIPKLAKEFSEFDPVWLVGRERLGESFSFQAVERAINGIFELWKALEDVPQEQIPGNVKRDIVKAAQNAVEVFKRIRSFVPHQISDAAARRNSTVEAVEIVYNEMYQAIVPPLIFHRTSGEDVRRFGTQVEQLVRETRSEMSTVLQGVKESEEQARDLLDRMKEHAGEAGVAKHARIFLEEANKHACLGKGWLAITAVLSVVAVVFAFIVAVYFFDQGKTKSTGEAWSAIEALRWSVPRLVAFSILYLVLVWSARNYRAHRHNDVVNRHRHNALSTFETFAKAAKDDLETRNAVLLRATEAIFSAATTGYLGKESEPRTPASHIIEFMRGSSRKE